MAKKENYAELADRLVELVGGKDNISIYAHCVTRLRINVKDKSLIQVKEIEKIAGVTGTQFAGDQFQIIIGQSVGEAYDLIAEKNGLAKEEAIDENLDADGKKGGFSLKGLIEVVSSCILPVCSAMIGAAMIKVVAILLNYAGLLSETSSTYIVLYMLGDAVFDFMPILVAYPAAKYFKTSPMITMALSALLVYGSFSEGLADGSISTIFGIPIYSSATYTGLLFPPILIAFVQSYVERFFKKHTIKMLEYTLTPTLTMFVMLPLTICALAPVGYAIGVVITNVCLFLYSNLGFVAVGVLTAIFPFLVVTGMHYAAIPAMTTCWLTWGYDPLVYPAMIIYNFCQGAAALGVLVKSRTASIKSTAASTAVTALVAGITEPTLFGISLRYRTPLIASMIGGFLGGCVFGLLGGGMYAAGGSGVFSIFAFVSTDPMSLVYAIIAVAVAMVATFVLVLVLYKDDSEDELVEEA